jgi:lysyl-tRNA synthetase class 2
VSFDLNRHFHHLKIRSLVIQAIRDFFTENRFLEIETPIRCPGIIPEAQIDPMTSDGYFLQASPELCMKRMLSKGLDKIFQICKCFRKNERGALHLPEMTLLEWYAADGTYLDLMDQCQGLIRFIAARLNRGHQIKYQGRQIQLEGSWEKLAVEEAFDRYTDTCLNLALKENRFDEIMGFEIEPCLGNSRPVFLHDYPCCLASLAKLLPDNPLAAQRFEFYMAGIELANGFTELTDPVEQRHRFERENRIRISRGKTAVPLPEKFLEDLTTMPDAAGIALGVDRLVMIFCDTPSIDDVVAFTPENL